jgi:hypothetical protein
MMAPVKTPLAARDAATAPGAAHRAAPAARGRHGGTAIKAPKARTAGECERLEQLPNIGPSLAADLRLLGIVHPRELAHRDPFVLYQSLCAKTGQRQDPCVLDTFMAATDFMRGAAPAPWWSYTPQRKALYGQL